MNRIENYLTTEERILLNDLVTESPHKKIQITNHVLKLRLNQQQSKIADSITQFTTPSEIQNINLQNYYTAVINFKNMNEKTQIARNINVLHKKFEPTLNRQTIHQDKQEELFYIRTLLNNYLNIMNYDINEI